MKSLTYQAFQEIIHMSLPKRHFVSTPLIAVRGVLQSMTKKYYSSTSLTTPFLHLSLNITHLQTNQLSCVIFFSRRIFSSLISLATKPDND